MAMHATPGATIGANGFDGSVDDGTEPAGGPARSVTETASGGGMRDVGAEAAAHSLLRLVAEQPGRMGRLRAARVVGGYSVPPREGEDVLDLTGYAVQLDWTLREITRLVDTLIDGGLMAQTPGPRPVLVLTRSGFRVLEALENGPPGR